jgi:hypothetical protein
MSVDAGPVPPPGLFRQRHRRLILAAVVVGFLLRLLLAVLDDVPSTDEVVYLRSGLNLWSGEGFGRDGRPELHFPPLVPALLGGAAEVMPDPHQATVLVTLAAGTLVILPITGLAGRLGGPRAAVAGAWLGALMPGLLVEIPTRGGGSEAPYLLLVLGGLYAAVRVLDADGPAARLPWAAGAGLAFGLAYLARPEGLWIGLAVLAVMSLVLLGGPLRALRRPRDALRRVPATAAVAAAFVALLAACVVPYTGYLEEQTGSRSLTAKTQDASIEAWRAVARGDRRARDAVLYALDDTGLAFSAERHSLTELIRDDPAGYLGIVAINTRSILGGFANLSSTTATLPGWRIVPLPILAAGLWAAWRRRRDRRVVLLAVAAAVPLATTLAFFFLPRYVVVTAAVAAVLGGLAWADLSELRPSWRRPALVVAAVALGWSFVAQTWGDRGPLSPREPIEQRLIGEWINDNTPTGTTIMTRSQVVAFYADRPTVAMPYASYDEILAFARHYGTGLLVADEYVVGQWRPQLRSLFGEGPWPGLVLVHQIEEEGRVVRVFDVGAESATFDGELPTLAHAGDGSPRREGR